MESVSVGSCQAVEVHAWGLLSQCRNGQHAVMPLPTHCSLLCDERYFVLTSEVNPIHCRFISISPCSVSVLGGQRRLHLSHIRGGQEHVRNLIVAIVEGTQLAVICTEEIFSLGFEMEKNRLVGRLIKEGKRKVGSSEGGQINEKMKEVGWLTGL